LYKHLHDVYKDFDKATVHTNARYRGWRANLRVFILAYKTWRLKLKTSRHSTMRLRKLVKIKEMQALEENVRNLEGQLKFEKGQWIELHEKYKDLLDWFFILDHWKGIWISKAVKKKLNDHLDEDF
jgi:hypothetical protein